MSHEHFLCQTCGTTAHINNLQHRITMPGDYCKTCAAYEQCAACGELYPVHIMAFKKDVGNMICNECNNDYHEVAKYIKPVYSFRFTVEYKIQMPD